MEYSELVQKMTGALLGDVIRSDLRKMQRDVRMFEYSLMVKRLTDAKNNGLTRTKKTEKAVEMLSQDITPFSELKTATAPDVLVTMVEALEELIAGYGSREPTKVAEFKNTVVVATKQRDYMLSAIGQYQIGPEKFLLLTNQFVARYLGCADYNKKVATFVTGTLAATNYQQLLVSSTVYLMFLNFIREYADFEEQGLPLFQFKQELKVLTGPGGQVQVIHMFLPQQGVYREQIIESNKQSLERQYNRYRSIVQLHTDLSQRYIAEIISRDKERIGAIYANNPNVKARDLISTVGIRLREIFEKNLFGSVQNLFDRYVAENREWLKQNKHNGSPLISVMTKIAHNKVTSTYCAKKIHADFKQNLKIVLMKDKNLKRIILGQPTQDALDLAELETKQMDVEQDAADGLSKSMGMDFKDTGEFQRNVLHRIDGKSNVVISGQYILTENDFRKYRVNFPVIQIERRLMGSIIVGLNSQAFSVGFRLNRFIAKIEEVDVGEINEFMKTSPIDRGAAGDLPKMTRFQLVHFGKKSETKKELEDEAMFGTFGDLDDMFNEMLKN